MRGGSSLRRFPEARPSPEGGCVGLYPAVAADLFGARHIGAMLGYLYTAVGVAALLGPTVTGFVFDRTGSYLDPILLRMTATVAAGS